MNSVFARLADDGFLVGLGPSDFARRAAELMAEINAGHPFREGNGRTQMTFLKLLVLRAGFAFNDDAIEPQSAMSAMVASFSGNLVPLTDLISGIVA